MLIENIVAGVNNELAGELLTYNDLKLFLDQTIDDINSTLDTCFPVFSEFSAETYPERYPDYNFFPDNYIRGVVIKGAASKFYTMDEEGNLASQQYEGTYQANLFKMLRDYLEYIQEEFQASNKSSVIIPDVSYDPNYIRHGEL